MTSKLTTYEELNAERHEKLEKVAKAIGYDLDYEPMVQMENISLLPDSFWHDNRAKGWGGSNEGVLNGISKYSSLPEVVNEKLLNKKVPVDDDKQFIFDFGHALEWVMLKRYAALNGYKYLTYIDYFLICRSKEDVSAKFVWMKKAQEGVFSFVTRNKAQAEDLLNLLKKHFPDSFIVEQESNDPKDVRDITDDEHAKYDSRGIVCVDRRQYINPNYQSMIGDMDGLCLAPDGTKIGIECKTYTHKAPKGCFTSGVLGDTGTIKNEEYLYQVQHYMAVCNIDCFDILACCGNTPDDFTVTRVNRSIEFEKALCENAQEAWERYIENMEVPEVYSLTEEQEKNLIRSMTPEQVLSDEMVEIPTALVSKLESIEKMTEALKFKKAEIDQLEEQIRALQVPIEEALSSNNRGFMITGNSDYDYEFEFKRSAGRAGFDQKKLKTEMPEIWERYRKPAEAGDRKFKFWRTKKRTA